MGPTLVLLYLVRIPYAHPQVSQAVSPFTVAPLLTNKRIRSGFRNSLPSRLPQLDACKIALSTLLSFPFGRGFSKGLRAWVLSAFVRLIFEFFGGWDDLDSFFSFLSTLELRLLLFCLAFFQAVLDLQQE